MNVNVVNYKIIFNVRQLFTNSQRSAMQNGGQEASTEDELSACRGAQNGDARNQDLAADYYGLGQ